MPEELTKNGFVLMDVNLLKPLLTEIVEGAIEKHFEKPKEEKMLSIGQVCAMLDVDKSTLWHWHNEGYLKKIYIGGKPRYKESEVNDILEGRNLLKRKHQTA